MTLARSDLAARLRPGELDRLAYTATEHADPLIRRAAAEALTLLAGRAGGSHAAPARPVRAPSATAALPAGVRRVTFAEASALAAAKVAAEEAAWSAFEAELGIGAA